MLERDRELKSFNTFGLDVKARWFVEYGSVEELRDSLKTMRQEWKGSQEDSACHNEDQRMLHVGQGSNLLFLKDYDGLVLHCRIRDIRILEETADRVLIYVGAGKVWDDFVAEAISSGWYGVENLTAIPGEVGAAAVQNIGAYGVEVKDFVRRVHVMDLRTLKECTFTCGEMQYAYRYSVLKSEAYWGRYAVTGVELSLAKTFVPRLEYGALASKAKDFADKSGRELTAADLRSVIKEMRDSKLPDPKVLGNAGSFFMNPVVERNTYLILSRQHADIPHYEVDETHVKIPAAWLIDKAGWKGKSMGPAGVYERQALVLVNLGGATGQDIVKLCEAIQQDVKHKFGIVIRPEVNFIS